MRLTVQFDTETDGRIIGEVPELRLFAYGTDRVEAFTKVVALAYQTLANEVLLGERDALTLSSLTVESPPLLDRTHPDDMKETAATAGDLLALVATFPPGTRSKEDIDRQLAEERAGWEGKPEVLVPHPDDLEEVRAAFEGMERGEMLSVEESALYLDWLETGNAPDHLKDFFETGERACSASHD